MLTRICQQLCPSPLCETVCPAGAVATEEKNVYLDIDKCNRCGICRIICMTLSQDKRLEKRQPWLLPHAR